MKVVIKLNKDKMNNDDNIYKNVSNYKLNQFSFQENYTD